MADHNLFLERLEDASLSDLLRERDGEPSRPLSEFLIEVDSEGERT